MPYLCTGFAAMTDEELREAAVALVAQFEHTGNDLYRQEADAALVEQARRMEAAPNPYEENGREGREGKAA